MFDPPRLTSSQADDQAQARAYRFRFTPRSRPIRVAAAAAALLALVATTVATLGNSPAASAAPTTYSTWPDTTVPKNPADTESASVELGTRFSTTTPGWVTGVRYYKSAQNIGIKTGKLWDPSGRLLAEVTFSGETRSGWQKATFATPVALKTGVNYTVSYRAPNGRYAGDNDALSPSKPKKTYALTATQGVYTYGPGMPTQTWKNSNYYVDIIFTTLNPTAPTPQPTTPIPTTTSPPKPTSTPTSTGTIPNAGWPDGSNTGVAGCPPLEKVRTGGQVTLAKNGQTFENKEFLDPTIITVHAKDVTIRCVKFNGTGWYGIDNTDKPTSTGVVVDRVDISCLDRGQVVGMLLHDATVSRANVSHCDHMINAGGDNLVIKDSYCHALTDLPVVHADCIQSMGGNTNLRIEHNSLWSRDTSDILLGQEYGEAKNVVITNNRLMSEGSPPPAYLLYLTGTNTVVTNNRFTRRYTYGHCTHNNSYPYTWSGNVWDDNGAPIPSC